MSTPTPGHRRSRRPLVLTGIAVAVLALAGVGFALNRSGDGEHSAQLAAVTPAVTTPAEVEPALDETTPPPSVTGPNPASKKGPLKLGQKAMFDEGGFLVEVVALKVKHGEGYEGVQVRTCNRGAYIGVSRLPWSLGYDSFESLHTIDTSGGGLPAPAYEDRELTKGQCAKGWVNFSDVPGERPDGIQYAPEGSEPIRWEF